MAFLAPIAEVAGEAALPFLEEAGSALIEEVGSGAVEPVAESAGAFESLIGKPASTLSSAALTTSIAGAGGMTTVVGKTLGLSPNNLDKLNQNVNHVRSITQQPVHARPNNFAGFTRIETSSQPQVATYKMSSLQSGAKASDHDVYVSYQAPPVSYFDNVNQQRGETLLAQAEYAIQQLKQSGEYQRAKRVYHISGGSKIGDEVARRMATTHNEVPTQVI